ncbi:MAG TPA: hypothetical protein VFG68_05435, partial [Fimbriiglobus sp.]|nr:hypothetical protein [Fimbriiglobus sp.]
MPTDPSLFDRERASFAQLLQLVRDRAAGERALTDEFAAATADADREVQRTRRTNAVSRKKELGELASVHSAALADMTGRLDAALADADRKRHDVRKRAVNEYSTALEKARTDYKDKLWTADSLLEAGEKEARDRYDDLKRKSSAAARRVEGLWAEATPRLARVRLSREKVAFDPARLPAPPDADPVELVQKSLDGAEAAAVRLAKSPLSKLRGVGPTLALFLLAGGVGAAIAFPTMDWPTNLYVALGWAVVGGLILVVLVGVLAKRQVKDRGRVLGAHLAESARAVGILDAYAETTHEAQRKILADKHIDDRRKTDEKYQPRIADLEQQLAAALAKIEGDHARFTEDLRSRRASETKGEGDRHATAVNQMTARLDAELAEAEDRFTTRTTDATAKRDQTWEKLSADWHAGLAEVGAACRHLADFGAQRFPPWVEVA